MIKIIEAADNFPKVGVKTYCMSVTWIIEFGNDSYRKFSGVLYNLLHHRLRVDLVLGESSVEC